MNDILNMAGDIIRAYNPALATKWDAADFHHQRINCAHAFAAGFAAGDPGRDVHPHAQAVLRAAYLTQKSAA